MRVKLHRQGLRLDTFRAVADQKLEEFPNIRTLLGPFIKKRLLRRGAARGVLTGALFDHHQSDVDLAHLEGVLDLGLRHCDNFATLFRGRGLSEDAAIADGQLLDLLAEIECFEFLGSHKFSNIEYVPRRAGKTVDFKATHLGIPFAVEATRLGLPQTPKRRVPGKSVFQEPGISIRLYTSDESYGAFYATLRSVIESKVDQMRRFLQTLGPDATGLLYISPGRGLFVTKFARREVGAQPNTLCTALRSAFNDLAREHDSFPLKHVALSLRKRRWFCYPQLAESASLDSLVGSEVGR